MHQTLKIYYVKNRKQLKFSHTLCFLVLFFPAHLRSAVLMSMCLFRVPHLPEISSVSYFFLLHQTRFSKPLKLTIISNTNGDDG